ncbi:response regulator [Massilia sp. Dwa41.01b]|uniref:response regulator n=1 Tax=unclassified Massilia TaxID=2609279 RepID=UPI0016039ADB|nr:MULTISPECIES: response regulator [unclassified Massilia]QNA89313.1 response regulator [Massilia sp. Dwa41.01b]QNB00212.1 response regulator [Massilia sp. Se16.2.3]
MKILLIEDNLLKRDKVHEFILSLGSFIIREAASYNAGLKMALNDTFDLLILDMSMPTFDRAESSHGGRFRALAGKEIATKLAKVDKLVPFVVLTGYKDFSIDSRSLSIDNIDESLQLLGGNYRGCIIFDVADSVWKDQLSSVIDEVNN